MLSPVRSLNRRTFLQASAAACGLACTSYAGTSDQSPLIDTHVYLERWPLRRVAGDEPADLVATLRRGNVTQAWAGSFDGLFHKDIHGVNLRLAEMCRSFGDGILVAFGAINPTLPDWEEVVRRCHEDFKMPGVRLHPAYHGYSLDDPRFVRLLTLANDRKLIVQLVGRLSEVRQMMLTPRAAQVDLTPLAKVRLGSKLRLLLSNCQSKTPARLTSLARLSNIFIGVPNETDGSGAVRRLLEDHPAERIAFGSGAPLFKFSEAVAKLRRSELGGETLKAIYAGTARRMMPQAHD